MSTRSRTQSTQSRRARREAERRAARNAPEPQAGRSPIIWITAAALIVGVMLIALLLITRPTSGPASLVPPSDPTPVDLADGRALGAAEAPVTLEIWADFQCPGCGIFSRATEARLVREFVSTGQLRLVYRDFAFLGDESRQAAIAARAAGEQGAFWPYHDWLFANQQGENQGAFRPEVLVAIAERVGLDVAAFRAAMADPELAAAVASETASGEALPVVQTPTLVLNGQQMEGVPSWDELSAAIEAAAGQASPAP